LWVIFALLNPDTDPGTPLNPDPQTLLNTQLKIIPSRIQINQKKNAVYAGLPPDVSLRLVTQGVLVDLSIAELVDVVVPLVLPELHLQHVAILYLRRGK
jgi:hypothetical protein